MTKLILVSLLPAILFVMEGKAALGQERKQLVQEVFQTELVYPQEKGELQLTTVARSTWPGRGVRIIQLPVLVEYGITDSWQLGIEWNAFTSMKYRDAADVRGVGDLSIATQYSFMNIRDSTYHAAVGLEAEIPVASVSNGISGGILTVTPFMVVAKDLPKLNYTHLFTQVRVDLVRRVRGRADDGEVDAHGFSWNAGVVVPVRRFRFTTEFSWSTNRWNHGGHDSETYLTPGTVVELPGAWEVGVGIPMGLTGGSDKFGVVFKVTREFGGEKDVKSKTDPNREAVTHR